jgi:hypothetical protein
MRCCVAPVSPRHESNRGHSKLLRDTWGSFASLFRNTSLVPRQASGANCFFVVSNRDANFSGAAEILHHALALVCSATHAA